jgi:hypothetical protein
MKGKPALRPKIININPLKALHFGLFIKGIIVTTKQDSDVTVIMLKNSCLVHLTGSQANM